MKKSLYLLLAVALVVAVARPTTIAVAQTSSVNVELQISELTALNLGEDGLFDDKIDEIIVYYGITEIDPNGREVNSTYGTYVGNFEADQTVTEFAPVILNVDPSNAVVISMLMIEVDSGNFDLTDYLDSDAYDANPQISNGCTMAAISSLLGLITGGANLTDPNIGSGLIACLGDTDSFLLMVGNGNDDLYTPLVYEIESDALVSGYVLEETFTFEWSGITNRSQYEIGYTVNIE